MLDWIDWRLVLVLICAVSALVISFAWWIVFNRSIWRIFFLFFGMIFGRNQVNPDAPIPIKPPEESLKDVMLENKNKHSFDDALRQRRGDTQTFTPLEAQQAPATPPTVADMGADPNWQPRLDPDTSDKNPYRAWRERRNNTANDTDSTSNEE